MDDVWNDAVNRNLLLTRIDVPLAANPVFAYDRSLRPILTMAAVIEDAVSGGKVGRVAIGTEWDSQVTLDLHLNGGSAEDTAKATLAQLPQTMRDADYLMTAGAVVLARLIKRMDKS